MNVGDDFRAFLRETMDDPAQGGVKVVAARVGVERTTLYSILRTGLASEMTVRRIIRAYPQATSTTSTLMIEPIPV